MARYDVRVVAAATGIDERWLSSLLSRVRVTGVHGGRQGRRRSLTVDAALCAQLAHCLSMELGASAESAVSTAHEALRRPAGSITLGGGLLSLQFDGAHLRQRLRSALDRAVEVAVETPRGRPRARSSRLVGR